MPSVEELDGLREVITENLRVQRGSPVDYVSVGTALQDAKAKQNHTIFARRGCGKTLLLHHSSRTLKPDMKAIYLNCEDFKRHSFPNVLIEILSTLFRELDKNLTGWFGRKRKSKIIIRGIIEKLGTLQRSADISDVDVRQKTTSESSSQLEAGVDIDRFKLGYKDNAKEGEEIERSFKLHREKLHELDRWLPELKDNIRNFFEISANITCVIIQIDDLYHLRRTDQASQ